VNLANRASYKFPPLREEGSDIKFTRYRYYKEFPEVLTFLVTNKCPCRCRHCFNWADKNPAGAIGDPQKEDLSLEEIGRVFRSFDPVEYVHLGGGEPFARPDMEDILTIIAKYCKPKVVSISTNGQFTGAAAQAALTFLRRHSKTELAIKVSIDGIGREHDEIRQRESAFDNAMKTYRALQGLKGQSRKIHVGFNTVYSALNQARIFDLYLYLSTLSPRPDCMALLLVRGTPQDRTCMENIDLERYHLWTDMYGKDMLEGKFEPDFDTRIATWLMHRYIYLTNKTNQRQINCYAGIAGAFIDNEGLVGGCETQGLYGSLRADDYDFKKIWFSDKAQAMRQRTFHECFCTNEPQWWHPSVRYNKCIVKSGARLCRVLMKNALAGFTAGLRTKLPRF
jgi:MoaA/NifB/PqqE/SkfB family radical SAM enzyme